MAFSRFLLITAIAALSAPTFAADAPQSDRQAAPFPRVGAYEVLRGDFHIHTPNSDGKLTPVQRVEEAWRHGYDVIAITDHGNFKAYEEALPLATELGLVLLRGMETGLDDREHLVALDLAPSYQPCNPHKWALTEGQKTVYYREQWPRLARDAGAFVIYAHPHVGMEEPVLWAIKEGLVKGIEVKNGVVGKDWNTVQSHGTWLYPQAIDWAIEHNLALFSNSDIHETRNETNSPVTLVLAEERSPEAVMDALRAGRTVAWFDGMLWGKKEVVEPFLLAAVNITLHKDGTIVFENNSPAPLTAVMEDKTVELKPAETKRIDAPPERDRITLRWINIWITSNDNLQTTHIR